MLHAKHLNIFSKVTVLLATYVKDLLLTLHQPKVFHGVDCVRQDTTAPQGQRMKDLVRKELTCKFAIYIDIINLAKELGLNSELAKFC